MDDSELHPDVIPGNRRYVIDKTLRHVWHCFSRGLYFYPYAVNGWERGGFYVVDDFGNLVQLPDQ